MSEYVDLGNYLIVKATDLAIGIDTKYGEDMLVWLPRSVVEDGDSFEEGEEHDISVKIWFAKKEGLV